jgi:hypothetical protein
MRMVEIEQLKLLIPCPAAIDTGNRRFQIIQRWLQSV